MMRPLALSLTWLLALQTTAAPAPALLPDLISPLTSSLTSSLQDIFSSLKGSDLGQIRQTLENIVPLPSPTSTEEALQRLEEAHAAAKPTGYLEAAAVILKQGLAGGDLNSILADLEGVAGGINNPSNNNPRKPAKKIFPKKSKDDGNYRQTEKQMREQIHIPSSFTYGEKPPVILVPGTGGRGGEDFRGNLIPLLQSQPYADIVWLNDPLFELPDIQRNAETVAYAINYISSISKNRKVSIIGWSQGSLDMQWALKYWPSARAETLNQVAISGDYAGTSFANLIDPGQLVPMPPSVLQQESGSLFIKTLRDGIGSSALVPTTSLYSGFFDEIVEPQQGTTASAYLDNANGIPVTNNQVQLVCPAGSPGAGFYSHESMLAHPLTFELIRDALQNGGPGNPDHLDLDVVCSGALAAGLDLGDFLLTERAIVISALNLILAQPRTLTEPGIRWYAM